MNIEEQIRQEVDQWKTLGHRALLQEFILRNGKLYEPIPRIGPPGTPKECFKNASETVLGGTGTYVEGFAVNPNIGLLIHHAWVDIDGKAMDSTWKYPLECQYFGVPFEKKVLIDELLKNEVYGILDIGMINVDLLRKIDLELVNEVLKKGRKENV